MSHLQGSSAITKLVHAIRRLLLDRNDVPDERHLSRVVEKWNAGYPDEKRT